MWEFAVTSKPSPFTSKTLKRDNLLRLTVTEPWRTFPSRKISSSRVSIPEKSGKGPVTPQLCSKMRPETRAISQSQWHQIPANSQGCVSNFQFSNRLCGSAIEAYATEQIWASLMSIHIVLLFVVTFSDVLLFSWPVEGNAFVFLCAILLDKSYFREVII